MAIKLDEFKRRLDSIGIPVAYRLFPVNQTMPLPCLIFYEETAEPFGADNEPYHLMSHLVVELYTKTKQPDIEQQVENALGKSYIFHKTEIYIPEEKMLSVIYEMEEL